MPDKVWYAAYGSNLSRARFDIYLNGGTPEGTTHAYPGCRDSTPPSADVAVEIEAELAFGGHSKTWGGGVAFIVPGAGRAPGKTTLARLYLITLGQFEDIVAQENWLDPGTVSLPSFDSSGLFYGVIVDLGSRDGLPVYAISQDPATPRAAPTPAYLRYIAEGLRDAHGLDAEQMDGYLRAAELFG